MTVKSLDLYLTPLPKELTNELIQYYERLHKEFATGDATSVVQNTGLFIEIAVRVCEHLLTGKYTPLEEEIKVDAVTQRLESQATTQPDTIRIVMPRLLRAVYGIRNKKTGVHFKGVNPVLADANVIITTSKWVICEFIRLTSDKSSEEIDEMLEEVLIKELPVSQKVGNTWRTLNPKFTAPARVLVLLYSATKATTVELAEWTKTKIKSKNHLLVTLHRLEEKELIHMHDGSWVLLKTGIAEAEKIINSSE